MTIGIDCHTLEIKDWAGKEKFLVSLLNEYKKNRENIFVLSNENSFCCSL